MSLHHGLLHGEDALPQLADSDPPLPATATPDAAYAHWARRLAAQHELGVARELAGLPESRLAALAAEFERTPQHRRSDLLRRAFPVAGVLLLFGAVLAMLGARAPADGALPSVEVLAMACLGGGIVALGLGALAAFGMKPLALAHAKLGVCAARLDEQHPWLYDASLLMRDAAADAYRRRILGERGPLRGLDVVMMREIARVNEALEMTRVARSVAEQLNDVAPALAVRAAPASVRPFEPAVDRRRPA